MDRERKDKIDEFHRKLNRRDEVPEGCYRRNSIHYRLVCYINNIIGLYLSSDFDGIPIFISRAYKEIKFIKKRYEENKMKMPPYYNLVLEYLSLMGEFSYSIESMADYLKARIPERLLQENIEVENI